MKRLLLLTAIFLTGYIDAEINKEKPGTGTHCQGLAADIKVQNGVERRTIVKQALSMGISVGVAKTFVHVESRNTTPISWCY